MSTGGMPEMVFEYILTKNGIDPAKDLEINQSIDFGSTAAAFSGGQGDFSVESDILMHLLIGNVFPAGGHILPGFFTTAML